MRLNTTDSVFKYKGTGCKLLFCIFLSFYFLTRVLKTEWPSPLKITFDYIFCSGKYELSRAFCISLAVSIFILSRRTICLCTLHSSKEIRTVRLRNQKWLVQLNCSKFSQPSMPVNDIYNTQLAIYYPLKLLHSICLCCCWVNYLILRFPWMFLSAIQVNM